MKKTSLILLALAFITISAFSQDVNSQLNPIITSVPSLTITPDSRAGGMGDVGAATTPDINSQYGILLNTLLCQVLPEFPCHIRPG